MSPGTAVLPETVLPDVFSYFEGGKSGVRSRLAKQIRDGLKEITGLDAAELQNYSGLPCGTISNIVAGKSDLIDADVIEAVADPINLKVDAAFGPLVNFSDADEIIWTRQADKERFVALAGADPTSWTSTQRVKLFVLLRAIREL